MEKKFKVLLANNHLDNTGGSETWTYTMAKEIVHRGDDLYVYTLVDGKVADKIREFAPVGNEPDDEYDILIINHRTCFRHLQDIKGFRVFTSHGVFLEMETPLAGADYYAGISEEVVERFKMYGMNLIRNGIDCERYKPYRDSQSLSRVLSLCQGDKATAIVKGACEKLGLEFTQSLGKWAIEEDINNADVVITLGRGAMEAMACGRAVIPFDYRWYAGEMFGDPIVTSDNYRVIMENNFSGRTFKKDYTVDSLAQEIQKYTVKMGETNRLIALEHFNIRNQVTKYYETNK